MRRVLLCLCVAAVLPAASDDQPPLSDAERLKAEQALARILIEQQAAETVPPEAERPLAIAEVACWDIEALLDQGRSGEAAERILAARKVLAELPESVQEQPPGRLRRVRAELLRLGSRLLMEIGLDEEAAADADGESAETEAGADGQLADGADGQSVDHAAEEVGVPPSDEERSDTARADAASTVDPAETTATGSVDAATAVPSAKSRSVPSPPSVTGTTAEPATE